MNGFARFILNLLVGMPFVFIGTAIVAGGIEQACGIIALSVVCTVGAGLLVWVPLCWFAGWLFFKIVSWGTPDQRGGSHHGAAERGNNTSQGSDLLAVCRYVESCQGKGVPAGQINQALLNQGWTDAIIKQAWEFVQTLK